MEEDEEKRKTLKKDGEKFFDAFYISEDDSSVKEIVEVLYQTNCGFV